MGPDMQNFMQIPLRGASPQMGEIYAKTQLQVRPFGGFLRAMAQTTRSRARMCLLGSKKFEIKI